ncbi:calcium permeable stress-gated cation channel, partial [Tremellales sp. Uapishka_1]
MSVISDKGRLIRLISKSYEPRTYIPPRKDQAPPLGRNLIMPLWKILMADPEDILKHNGVDPYVFVRFLYMMSKAMVPIWLLSWIVLLPVDAANSNVLGKSGLDRLTFGNVSKDKQSRYWAHLILDYVFIGWILFLIWQEMQHWLVIRQRHLINPEHSRLAQANTVLITDIPPEFLDEERLEQLYAHLPGGVKRIWLNSLVKLALKHKLETEKRIQKLEKKKKPVPPELTGPVNPDLLSTDAESGSKVLSLADQLVPRNQRPTTRLKPSWAPFGLGFLGIGEKVDTIEWARKVIQERNEGLSKSREQLRKDVQTPGIGEETYPPLNSAFIHFNQQIAAHMAVQCLAHSQPTGHARGYPQQDGCRVVPDDSILYLPGHCTYTTPTGADSQHTFLITTLSSGLIASIKPIAQDPASIATILAAQLPTASTFFITLVLTQFTGTVGNLLQPFTLLLYYIRLILTGGTPLQTQSWGTTFPGVTVYGVIMISYMVISPVINGFGAMFFVLSAIIYKYLFIWVDDQPVEADTGGLFFPKAVTHLFVGMYIQEIALCALFFLARDENNKVSAIPQGALMVAIHYILLVSYGPLINSLPLSLAYMSYGMPKETGHEGSEAANEPAVNSSTERLTLQSSPQIYNNEKQPRSAEGLTGETQTPNTTPSASTRPGPPVSSEQEDVELGNLGHNQEEEEDEEAFFAVPGGPGVVRGMRDDGNDPDAFFHPATKEPQRILWLPRDELGLTAAEIKENGAVGIQSTDQFAVLNHKGKVKISGPPPDDIA